MWSTTGSGTVTMRLPPSRRSLAAAAPVAA